MLHLNGCEIMESKQNASHNEISDANLECRTDSVVVKHEIDIVIEDHNIELQIKLENESNIGQEQSNISKYPENPYEDVYLEVKKEEESRIHDNHPKVLYTAQDINDKEDDDDDDEGYVLPIKTSAVDCREPNLWKNESAMEEESLVSYDYPDFNDASVDGSEVTALGNVEACLQDDITLNYNQDTQYVENQQFKHEMVSDTSIMETHLISNKMIKTSSTVTNSQDGLVESQTTKTLVMEILPMANSNILNKLGNPEEILPTSNDTYYYDDTFQLNSITGNVLSLEQEAYSLLKANRKKDLALRKYNCTKCPKAYNSASSLRKHLLVHDSIEKRAMGVIKGQKTRLDNMHKKLQMTLKKGKSKKKVNICDTKPVKKEENPKKEGYHCTCGNVFRRRSRMETCLRSHNLFSDAATCFSCITCTKEFKDKDQLASHRKRIHSKKKFPCKFCPTDYNTRKELFKHLQKHQKVQLMEYQVISEVMKGKQKLKCFMCSKSCSELSELKSHVMDDHKEPYVCPHCKSMFNKIIDFGNHTKMMHPEVEGQSVLNVLKAFSKLAKAWKCEECELQFHEADKLALHRIEKHSPEINVESQFQCADCRRVFITQKGLTSHRRVHHNTEILEESEKEDKGVMCLECRKVCKDIIALTSHMRLHSPERKYPCKFCEFRFATPEKRKAHAEIHTGDMKYVCFICEYQCSSENRLKHHKMSVKHLSMKEYLLTGKSLIEDQISLLKKEKVLENRKKKKRSNNSDNESESTSDSGAETEVTCDICGEKFRNESLMLEHKQIHPFIEFPNEDTPTRIFFK